MFVRIGKTLDRNYLDDIAMSVLFRYLKCVSMSASVHRYFETNLTLLCLLIQFTYI